MLKSRRFGWALAPLALLSGCALWGMPDGEENASPAKKLARIVTDERIVLEVFFVHVPQSDQALMDSIWQGVDEQTLPIESRQRLAQSGFRLGVVGSQLPPALDELIKTSGTTASAEQAQADAAEAQPIVSRQEIRLHPGKRGEIVPSPVHEKMTVVSIQNGEMIGKTYEQAQGRLKVQCRPQGDGRVEVELVPELHHGQSKRRAVGEDGVLRLETGQDRLALDHLRTAIKITPGQTILLGCRSAPLRSLGRDFLTDSASGKPVQKLLVMRLVQSPFDDTLSTMQTDEP